MIILDFKIDDRVPILLGRPFLEMGGALIDVRKVILTMRLDDEEVVFKVYIPLNTLSYYNNLCMITVMDVD